MKKYIFAPLLTLFVCSSIDAMDSNNQPPAPDSAKEIGDLEQLSGVVAGWMKEHGFNRAAIATPEEFSMGLQGFIRDTSVDAQEISEAVLRLSDSEISELHNMVAQLLSPDADSVSSGVFQEFLKAFVPDFVEYLYESNQAANLHFNFITLRNLALNFARAHDNEDDVDELQDLLNNLSDQQQIEFVQSVMQEHERYLPPVNDHGHRGVVSVNADDLKRAVQVAQKFFVEDARAFILDMYDNRNQEQSIFASKDELLRQETEAKTVPNLRSANESLRAMEVMLNVLKNEQFSTIPTGAKNRAILHVQTMIGLLQQRIQELAHGSRHSDDQGSDNEENDALMMVNPVQLERAVTIARALEQADQGRKQQAAKKIQHAYRKHAKNMNTRA